MRRRKKRRRKIKCELCKINNAVARVTTLDNKKLRVCKYCFNDLLPYIKSYDELPSKRKRKLILHHDIISGRLVRCKL